MFLIDKYQDLVNSKSFSDLPQFNYQPNMILYGINSYGKKYYLNYFLKKFYGETVLKTEDIEYEINGYGNSKTEITLTQSPYHLIFKPNSNGYDKYILQKIINDFCQSPLVTMVDNNIQVRTIIIDRIDNLNYYSQAALRRIMEKYIKVCRFILISDQLSKVSETIRSRCCLIRIPYNTVDINKTILTEIGKKEKISQKIVEQVCQDDNLDIKQLLWKLLIKRLNLDSRQELGDYMDDLMKHIDTLTNKYTFAELVKLRKNLHLIYISNFPIERILRELLKKFMEKDLSIEKKFLISKEFMNYNVRINQGKRNMIHVESLIFNVIKIIIG